MDAASFLESGLIDSTGILELVTFLESTYSIRIAEEGGAAENLGLDRADRGVVRRKIASRDEDRVQGLGHLPCILTGLLHHHRKSMNIKELRIRTWVNASDCPARSYAQSVAPSAVSSLLQATYVDQEKQRKSCPYKDLCLYC